MSELFTLHKEDENTQARLGALHTDHGIIETPCFMPVGTQGTVKTLTPDDLSECGAGIILGNTYYLYLRPGDELVRQAGGLHQFMQWKGPILTDSGGYQVFSLADLRKISDDGIRFQSRIDGSYHMFTAESVVDIQRNLGSDFVMPLDCPTGWPAEPADAERGHKLTLDWAARSVEHFHNTQPKFGHRQFHFGIVQGAFDKRLREASAGGLTAMPFDAYAVGGLSVGEPADVMYEMTRFCTDRLPKDKPRYLMGVGKPENLIECVLQGIDMFDCVLPTRNGRRGWFFTRNGRLVIRNAKHRDDFRPIDEQCSCYGCRNFTRAYLRHLFVAREILALRIATLHNLTFYLDLMQQLREAIRDGRTVAWRDAFLKKYQAEDTK
jgi:queuine tRNA-ribosyltransferase